MSVDKDRQAAQIKSLIALGQEKGYLTYDDVNEYLSDWPVNLLPININNADKETNMS